MMFILISTLHLKSFILWLSIYDYMILPGHANHTTSYKPVDVPGPAVIKPGQFDPSIGDQLKITHILTIVFLW